MLHCFALSYAVLCCAVLCCAALRPCLLAACPCVQCWYKCAGDGFRAGEVPQELCCAGAECRGGQFETGRAAQGAGPPAFTDPRCPPSHQVCWGTLTSKFEVLLLHASFFFILPASSSSSSSSSSCIILLRSSYVFFFFFILICGCQVLLLFYLDVWLTGGTPE